MKIVLDARYLDGTFSGIGTYSEQLIEHLALVDTSNQYHVLVRPGYEGELKVGPNFQLLSYRPKPVSFATLFNLADFVDSLRADVMHSFFPIVPVNLRTPLIVTLHDLQPFVDPDFSANRPFFAQWAYNRFYRAIYPAAFRRAKWILPVSYHTRDLCAEEFPDLIPKLVVVTSGLDPALFEPIAADPEETRQKHGLNRPYLLYYGSTRPNKNLPVAVRGFAEYLRRSGDRETELVLILKKDRFFRDIRNAIRQQKVGGRVRVMEQVSELDRRAILAQAAVFVFPTKYEGFGFPPLEAMAAGVPVLAGDSGALPEVCGDAAEFVSADDPNSIADGIGTLLSNADRRQALIEKGRARARQFNWTEAATRIRDIYQLLC